MMEMKLKKPNRISVTRAESIIDIKELRGLTSDEIKKMKRKLITS
jgi:hypothetical protein